MTRIDRESVFVLHRRPYRDTSLIVDLFSPGHGRFAAVARGARRRSSAWMGLIEPFRPLEAGWMRRGELATLTRLDPAGTAPRLAGRAVWAGLYANELLLTLSARDDPEPTLFHAYARLITQLAHGERSAGVLRAFELELLAALGVVPELQRCAATGDPVLPEARYRVDAERGPLPVAGDGIRGRVLLALAAAADARPIAAIAPEHEREALIVMRQLIDRQLAGRSLRTPALYRELNP
ncbi:MAG: DNA repair protein RecO [Wenzhouxiangellaceae bacterium]|nr:DNA repair protein RecO [Wenzhouxiangellaceae bacterium]